MDIVLKNEIKNLSFGRAIAELKFGSKVQREGWNGKGMFLIYFSPVQHNMETLIVNGLNQNYPLLPFILMKTADNMLVPWLASQTDVLAEDWQILK